MAEASDATGRRVCGAAFHMLRCAAADGEACVCLCHPIAVQEFHPDDDMTSNINEGGVLSCIEETQAWIDGVAAAQVSPS